MKKDLDFGLPPVGSLIDPIFTTQEQRDTQQSCYLIHSCTILLMSKLL